MHELALQCGQEPHHYAHTGQARRDTQAQAQQRMKACLGLALPRPLLRPKTSCFVHRRSLICVSAHHTSLSLFFLSHDASPQGHKNHPGLLDSLHTHCTIRRASAGGRWWWWCGFAPEGGRGRRVVVGASSPPLITSNGKLAAWVAAFFDAAAFLRASSAAGSHSAGTRRAIFPYCRSKTPIFPPVIDHPALLLLWRGW